jgi:hypothetical protein
MKGFHAGNDEGGGHPVGRAPPLWRLVLEIRKTPTSRRFAGTSR